MRPSDRSPQSRVPRLGIPSRGRPDSSQVAQITERTTAWGTKPWHPDSAFTLIELLVVIGIIGVLVGITVPATSAIRRQAQKCVCASNLRQVGNSLLMYVQDHKGRLPYVVEPMWSTYAATGRPDLSIDPRTDPRSFINVMRPYGVSEELLTCPSYVLKTPSAVELPPVQTYRFSSANNADGAIRTIDYFFRIAGSVDYKFSMKYLNGRRYGLDYVMLEQRDNSLVGVFYRGVGHFYLARDFVASKTTGIRTTYTPPHNKQFNQLRVDMSVSLEKDEDFGFTSP